VVTGHQDRQIRDILAVYRVRVAYNPEYESGMASSIRRGILACRPEAEGYMICLGDMPLVELETLRELCTVFSRQNHPSIVVATTAGTRGHPIIFSQSFRTELLQLQGDVGARSIVEASEDVVIEVDVNDPGIFKDIDTLETYDLLRSR
jgi:molybdenum cofactor cytidylyltransferase